MLYVFYIKFEEDNGQYEEEEYEEGKNNFEVGIEEEFEHCVYCDFKEAYIVIADYDVVERFYKYWGTCISVESLSGSGDYM